MIFIPFYLFYKIFVCMYHGVGISDWQAYMKCFLECGCGWVSVCVCAPVCMCTCTCVCLFLGVWFHTSRHLCICTYMYLCILVCMHVYGCKPPPSPFCVCVFFKKLTAYILDILHLVFPFHFDIHMNSFPSLNLVSCSFHQRRPKWHLKC